MTRRRLSGPVAALVTLAVLGGSGAAVAAWSANAALSATASSAAPATTATQADLATTYQYTGSSSGTVFGSLTIKNTGGTPLTYTLANEITGSPVLAQRTTLSLWKGNCAGPIPANAVKTTLADTKPALPEGARTLTANAEVTICAATRIEGTGASTTVKTLQGQSVTATFSVKGAVGTSWTATATTDAVTQSVYQLASPATVTCDTRNLILFRRVELSWAAPTNRPSTRTEITYQVVDTLSGRIIKEVKTNSASPSITVGGDNFDTDGTYTLAIQATEPTYGTTSPRSASFSIERTSGRYNVISSTDCA